jgi:hypothetical protein
LRVFRAILCCADESGTLESAREKIRGWGMIAEALLGLSLIVNVSIQPGGATALSASVQSSQYSDQQRNAAVRPLMKAATECIARRVVADPRFAQISPAGDVGDLIVESISPCLSAVRALIDAHDEFFGDGTGESFFMGPYLDALPAAVSDLIKSLPK